MHADWVQLMATYADTENVLIANADCDTQYRQPGSGKELCDHYSLPYYPYIVYGDPDGVQEYKGEHDYASLKAWAEQQLGPVDPTPSPAPAPAPTPPVPTPSPSGSCSTQRGYYSGEQLEVLESMSSEDCCDACVRRSGCASAMLSENGACYLMAAGAEFVEYDHWTAIVPDGVRKATPATPSATMLV